ncbi:hypothetical protein AC579_9355 [Pseudocercospora musae]|uniref:Uncharacterized protein n=1 Tax=Pseudocercospora musae TaxID=113226 RepID=A0A139I2K9_9PEZI|nr:hypothetical protein AC579_9355 [Pseudocercospora musae]
MLVVVKLFPDYQHTDEEITAEAVKYELTMLDDEFFAKRPENLRFMGNPRPEFDQAWSDFLGKGRGGLHSNRWFNLRVPKDAAKKAGFQSIELDDGSGDLWASTAFFHNLHCIKYLRQAQFPEAYPKTWEIMKPLPDGSISLHADHCLENLRQAIMCGGDMALYHYYWNASSPTPSKASASSKTPHICVNWEHLISWMRQRSFSLQDGLLKQPAPGLDPSG